MKLNPNFQVQRHLDSMEEWAIFHEALMYLLFTHLLCRVKNPMEVDGSGVTLI